MALIEFKNLPDTSTPLNAENLNNNFQELEKINEDLKNELVEQTKQIEKLQNDLYYKPGDTYSSNEYLICSGFITTGTTEVQINLRSPKSLKNIKTITITSLYLIIRGISGYLDNRASRDEYVGISGYSLNSVIADNYNIRISIIKNSAFTNVTNNTPVVVAGMVKLTFS